MINPMPLTKITLLAIAAALTAVANDLEGESETNGEPAAPVTPKKPGRPKKTEPVEAESTRPTAPLATSASDEPTTVTVEQLKAAGDPLVKANKGQLIKDLFKIHGGGTSYSTTPDEHKATLLVAIQALAKEVPAPADAFE